MKCHYACKSNEHLIARRGFLGNVLGAAGVVGGLGAFANPAVSAQLESEHPGLQLIMLESGGDNLASTFSLDLVDWWMFVIDVAGGGDIPRKRGPGVLQSDLLVINKSDLAEHVGVDLELMVEEAFAVREGRPVAVTDCRHGLGLEKVLEAIRHDVLFLS